MPFPKGQLSNTPNLQHKRILGPINQSKSRILLLLLLLIRLFCTLEVETSSLALPAPRQNNEKLFSEKKKKGDGLR